jgi:phospho-N-acetylmuramoyl-pentapeptide-transferase
VAGSEGERLMLYHLLYPLSEYISGLNLFRYITFRTAGAVTTAIIICLLLGPFFIRLLRKYQVAERIREEGPAHHHKKAGTPTMGGLIVLSGIVIPTLLWADLSNYYILMVLLVTIWLGALGFLDDYLKVIAKQPKGLVARKKMIGQVLISVLFALGLQYLGPQGQYDGTTSLPFFKNYVLTLGVFYIPFVIVVIAGFSNAVNLTDGLDGLAIGLCGLSFLAFGGIAYVTGRLDYSGYLQIDYLPGAGELAVFCGAAVGSALGFLWFNSHPAEVFMGDTGSLALGGALGSIAILMKKELLLVIVGGAFVVTALSVILQVLSYRYRGGKRIFKMAPLHHHFELIGWPESKIVVRYWIVGALCSLLTLATLKIR